MENQQPWHLTILHLEGLRHMRPEKVWRPIVTFELDKHYHHETVLGVDGQNINQKESFKFYGATPSTKMEVKVWYRFQSKKKKRRVLVASAAHSLSELIKKQEADSKIEVRLICRATENRSVSSRQKGALLQIKLRAPTMQRPQTQPEIKRICLANEIERIRLFLSYLVGFLMILVFLVHLGQLAAKTVVNQGRRRVVRALTLSRGPSG